MSIYSKVTEQDLENLRKLANQQKNERAQKIRNKFLKQTHDKKLSESLSPITKSLDLVENNKGEKIGELIIKSEQETPQLAIESTQTQTETPQLPIENILTAHQPVENNECVIYDVELENTLNNMQNNAAFFKIEGRDNGDVFWNGFPVEKIGGNKIKINENVFDITQGIQEVLTDTSNIPIKKLNDQDREIFNNISESLDFKNYKPVRGESKSGRYKQSKSNFNKRNLEGQGIEKIIIPNNIIDIYTRLEILLGLKLSGHTDTLTEASALLDKLYELGEIQNKQQYRNALNNFNTQ